MATSSSGNSASGHSNRGTRVTAATLAVVDLGSNSFRLEIGRVEGGQIYRQDTWRETLRFGAGLDSDGRIKPAAMKAAIECLQRFRERLSGVHPSAVRAVATNTFRVAKNAREFLPHAERALGFPIDVIGGHEEARLIYLGVAPLARSEFTRDRLDLDPRRHLRCFERSGGDFPVGEKALRHAHASDFQRFEALGFEPATDDELRRATADVDDQARRG